MIAKKMLGLALAGAVLSSCTVVRQGDVGVKRTLGKISKRELQPGPRVYNPFLTTIIQVPTRTTNLEVKLDLPSKEGLNVGAEISILYHIDQRRATDVVGSIGPDYELSMILPVFRAAAADVTAGIRDANKIISEGLTPQIIQYKTIEAYRELSKSTNTKVIVGGGKDFILNP